MSNKILYDCFSHWYRGGGIYLIGDTHFGDEETNLFRENNISDEEQVKRINSKIGKKDVIIFLGDVGSIEYVKKIRGYKILILGNHDKGASNYRRVVNEIKTFNSEDLTPEQMNEISTKANKLMQNPELIGNVDLNKYFKSRVEDNHLFDEVYEGPLIISKNIILSHEPVDFKYCFNIHGHCHCQPLHRDDMHLNIVAENIDFTPVSLNELIKSGLFKDVSDIHRDAIDKQIYKKAEKEILFEDKDAGIVLKKPNKEEIKNLYRDDYLKSPIYMLEYKKVRVPVYSDDYGQQDIMIFNEKEYCGGAYNVNAIYDFCYIIDEY